MLYPWELQLRGPGNYNFHRKTAVCLCVSRPGCDVSAGVHMCWSELPVRGRLDSDVSTQTAAVVSEVGLRFGTVWSCSSWNGLPRESWESGHKPPPKGLSEKQIGDDPNCSMLLVDVLWCCSHFLCATLFYAVTKIILCLYDSCVCACACLALRTGSSSDALTPLTIDITMESPSYWSTVPSILALPSDTHMENYHRVVLWLYWPAGGYIH